MDLTPSQKSERNLTIAVIIVILLFVMSVAYCFTKQRVVYSDKITGTKIIDCGKFNKVVYSNGEVLAYGNEKSEYENNEIGE